MTVVQTTQQFSNTRTEVLNTTNPFVDKNMLHNLLSVQSKSGQTLKMQKFITRFAKKQGATVVTDDGNIYVTKGNADVYPCMVAHTDTVHKIISDNAFSVYTMDKDEDTYYFGWDRENQTFAGVGGDDKVGIFLALSALVAYDNVKLAFFRDEEIGCAGSRKADMSFFEDVSFVLQGDRRGNSDFVTDISGPLSSQDFQKEITPILDLHGYKFSTGAMTDVEELKEKGLEVSCANFSCGYWNPHTAKEIISLNDLNNTLSMVFMTIDKMGGQKWPHKASRVNKWANWQDDVYDGWGSYQNYGGRASTFQKTVKAATRTAASYRTVKPTEYVQNDWDTYLQLTQDGCCPMCMEDAYVEYDTDLNKFLCNRCVIYLDTDS